MKYFTDHAFSISSKEDFFPVFQQLGFGEIHIKQDKDANMLAIITIHSTLLGPALGGCRYLQYPTFEAAMIDALRLAHGMSYKAAICNLPLGGGKAVLLKSPTQTDKSKLFRAFGHFVNELGGRYITAEDSGTSLKEMDIIRTITPYVTGDSSRGFVHTDPSPLTALGLRRGIEAALSHKLQRDTLAGTHIAIQGVGNVGYHLAKECHRLGAILTISDINPIALKRCQEEFNATLCPIEEIHKVACDVFSPCALGSAITFKNVDEIKAPIVAGSANNQLENSDVALKLFERGILYAPDYVINSGGLIHATAQYFNQDENAAKTKIENIFTILRNIFEEADKEQLSPLIIANRLAEKRLY